MSCLNIASDGGGSRQKLLRFCPGVSKPQSVLHRWIRTGQVRINGGRPNRSTGWN